ncbi:replication-relaxation family protein [Amycolatopsis sp. RTGN1]|uniref:replication-relaxation family protein n=1 Tax=Amycolatopsis ponsaeliensis TaxID=2992142 RepID=UPI00254CC147|nr:replication-relaxation family protein [Amycolatopsis sp. RTGN1]
MAILADLQTLRLMTGGQVLRQHFPGGQPETQARKARAALARFHRLGLVVRLRRRVGGVRAGSQGYVYGLTGLGLAVLDVDSPTPKRHRRVVETKPAFADHTLAITELHVQLTEFSREHPAARLDFAAEPQCWRTFPGPGGVPLTLKPDAHVHVERDGYELTSFVEVDMATESLPTIHRKLDVYISYWRSGLEQARHEVFPRTWWTVPTPARRDAIQSVIRRLPTEAQGLFAVCLADEAVTHLTAIPNDEGGAQ